MKDIYVTLINKPAISGRVLYLLTGTVESVTVFVNVETYQYNTGSHRRPRSHDSSDPKFLDGRSSTNFGSQSDLIPSSKAFRAVDESCDVFVLISHHLKNNDDSSVTSVRFLCF